MTDQRHGAPDIRPPSLEDFNLSLRLGLADFAAAPLIGLFFAGFYVLAGLLMSWITIATGHTFWLILAVLGFPLVGAFAALGFYETSRRRARGTELHLSQIAGVVRSHKNGQLPWFAVLIVVIFLFWFFLGHMIFALFLGLSPMTHISTSLTVFTTPNGIAMIGFGSCVGAVFAVLVFSISVLGIPMLLDRDVDFITAILTSISAVRHAPLIYLGWGIFLGLFTLLALLPFFLGLFVAMPVFGHATWHLYTRVSQAD